MGRLKFFVIFFSFVVMGKKKKIKKDSPICIVCELIVNNIHYGINRKIDDIKAHQKRGGYRDDVIYDEVSTSCLQTNIYNKKTLRKVCDDIIIEHDQTIADFFVSYSFERQALDYDSYVRGWEQEFLPEDSLDGIDEEGVKGRKQTQLIKRKIHEQSQALCYRSLHLCPRIKKMRGKSQKTSKKDGKIQSQHPPWPKFAPHPSDGRVWPVVAGTLVDTIQGTEESGTINKDVLIYYSSIDGPCYGTAYHDAYLKPTHTDPCYSPLAADKGQFHRDFYHVYQELALLFNGSTTLYIGHFDGRSNDLFGIYAGIDGPQIILYPAHDPMKPSYKVSEYGDVPLYDIVAFLLRSASPETIKFVQERGQQMMEKDRSRMMDYHSKEYFMAKSRQDKKNQKSKKYLSEEDLVGKIKEHEEL